VKWILIVLSLWPLSFSVIYRLFYSRPILISHITSVVKTLLNGSPYSMTDRRVPELIPVLGSQPADDVSHKPDGRLPLLSARPAVTHATLKRAATYFAAWWTKAQWVWASGVARNFRQGVRQSVAFLSVHSSSAALPSRPYNQKTSWHTIILLNDWTNDDNTITLRNHIGLPKIKYFLTSLTPLVWLRRWCEQFA